MATLICCSAFGLMGGGRFCGFIVQARLSALRVARATFIGALKLGFEVRQEDACLFVVLDFGLICLFAEEAMYKFKAHSTALILYASWLKMHSSLWSHSSARSPW